MKRRTKESQKKSKMLFLIILIAALISVTGTYAWFSTQRDVEIVGFRLNVEIAENLEISLDGEKWTHSINIYNMRQFYGTYDPNKTYNNGNGVTQGAQGTNAAQGTNGAQGSTDIYQAKKDAHRNYVPTELLPISTIGSVQNGNLLFAIGDIKDKKLSNIKKCSEEDITVGSTIVAKEGKNDAHPYLVFDMYLRNLSRLSQTGDILQLNTGSYVSATGTNTGLEYSVRVGLVEYGNTISIHDQDADVADRIRNLAPNGNETVAIWEPNSKFHIPYVVSNDERINTRIQGFDTRAIAVTAAGELPTTIEDVTDPNETALQVVSTNKPTQAETQEAMTAKQYETTELHDLVQTDGETMRLAANAITKVRCYIWLEGQDPDCVDLASTGQEVAITLRLIKPKSTGGSDNTYAD